MNPLDQDRLLEKQQDEADCFEDALKEDLCCPVCKGPNREVLGETKDTWKGEVLKSYEDVSWDWISLNYRPFCSEACYKVVLQEQLKHYATEAAKWAAEGRCLSCGDALSEPRPKSQVCRQCAFEED